MDEAQTILWGAAALIALVPLGQVIINAINLGRTKTKDDKADSAQNATVLVELGTIKSGIQDIKAEQKAQRETNIEFVQRLTAVEESAKQAHKRIDRLHEPGAHTEGERHA